MEEHLKFAQHWSVKKEQMEKVPAANVVLKLVRLQNHCFRAGNEVSFVVDVSKKQL